MSFWIKLDEAGWVNSTDVEELKVFENDNESASLRGQHKGTWRLIKQFPSHEEARLYLHNQFTSGEVDMLHFSPGPF